MQVYPNHPRGYRVRDLAMFVLAMAFLCGAIRSPTPGWSLAVSELTLFILLYSLLAVSSHVGRSRNFWMGFASLGWGRLILGHTPWLVEFYDSPLHELVKSLESRLYPGDMAIEFYEIGPKAANLIKICENIIVLTFAEIGGIIGWSWRKDAQK